MVSLGWRRYAAWLVYGVSVPWLNYKVEGSCFIIFNMLFLKLDIAGSSSYLLRLCFGSHRRGIEHVSKKVRSKHEAGMAATEKKDPRAGTEKYRISFEVLR